MAFGSPAQERRVPDTYTAITTNMTPAGVELKADILEWSDDDARAAVIDALAAEDPVAALKELPTAGVVWRSGSAVGHSVKYAHRETLANGDQQITLVTDRVIGSTSFNPWTAGDDATVNEELGYSVVEMNVATDGSGTGTMSLAAEIVIDPAANTIGLAPDASAPSLLADVALQPKPYWAEGS
ncbi:MAG: hypothetical protein R3305_05575 [Gammaproteobacteria bacterium]|nr:hypothetical protein [Gammaproteobacteria bacterium]